MGLKVKLGAVGLVGSVGIGGMYTQSNDLLENYQPVEAVITDTTVDCFIKNRKSKLEDKTTGKLSYMDCRVAPLIAVRFDFDADDIKQRVKATYLYTSPLDGKKYNGDFTREGREKAQELSVGKKVPVFASKTEPEKSRTSSSNMFVDDQYEI